MVFVTGPDDRTSPIGYRIGIRSNEGT
ncbi:hypothetical protein CCACVL1_05675 [Corchorus capsularis]|uniref:Uncharacterized protein n=1 Tax=Corchorus capsularis TaxID=210143 RepID=A0A1R3JJL0_COCAP|nr:hypothetical protein CCACVL1_05675 [Corchorus capsularis]